MSHKPHRRREGELLGNQERLKVEGREVVEIEEQIKERLFIFQVQLLKTYSSRAPPHRPSPPRFMCYTSLSLAAGHVRTI